MEETSTQRTPNGGSRLTNRKGSELYHAIKRYNCEVHTTGKPTYWPTDRNKIPDLIDFFVSRNLSSSFLNIIEEFDLDSDRSPIVLTLSETIIKKEKNPTLSNRLTDWDMFRGKLENRISFRVTLKTNDEIEEIQKFVTDIQQCAWETTPLITKNVKANNYPKDVREIIAEKREKRKNWQTTRDPRIKTELNRITQDLRRTIQEIPQRPIKGIFAITQLLIIYCRKRQKIKRPIVQILRSCDRAS